jgi:hypothetical protein
MPEPATVHNELKLRNIIIKPILYVKKVGEMIFAHLGVNSYIPFFALHCKQDPIYVFPEMKLRWIVPNFHNNVSRQKQDFLPIKSYKIKYTNVSKNLRYFF